MPQSLQHLRAKAMPIKANVIEWSESLEGCGVDLETLEDRCCYCVWIKGEPRNWWSFCFLKHGNEYFYEGGRFLYDDAITKYNKQDMKPILMHNGAFVPNNPAFSHIFDCFDLLFKSNHKDELKKIGSLLLRDSFYLEHRFVEAPLLQQRKGGEWMPVPISGYSFLPSPLLMEQITTTVPFLTIDNLTIDTEAYLHYIDGIAQNESVKYHHKLNDKGDVYDVVKEDAGRESCLLTLVNYIYGLLKSNRELCATIRRDAGRYPHSITEEDYPTYFSLEELQ